MKLTQLAPSGLRRSLARLLKPVPKSRTRRHIRAGMDSVAFFETLKAKSCNYVVLRWFDSLPHIAPGEDIDLLVADGHLPLMASLMDEEKPGQPCDVYTVTGVDRTTFRQKPYYPRHLSEQILARAVWQKSLFRVPCPEDHFFSLAYHAVYHKGPASGLASSTPGIDTERHPDHDYAKFLRELAAECGFTVRLSLEDLDAFLAERGFRPDRDTLSHLKNGNSWAREKFFA